MTEQIQQPDFPDQGRTANDRFKRSFSVWFSGAITAATAVHFLIFAFWPTMAVVAAVASPDGITVVDVPKVDLPDSPDPIAPPAMPVITDSPVDPDIPFLPNTFDQFTPDRLPPPPGEAKQDRREFQAWTTYDVRPDYRNKDEIERALEREYPPIYRDAGIGGTAVVRFFIDETGRVVKTELQSGTGYDALDNAALKVAEIARFTPALNRDKPVPVWIALAITFTTR